MSSDFTLAIHSLTYLALQPDRMSTSNAISESACVHPVRIRKVLSLLKKHKFIQSKEGTGGGFIFARDLDEVNLWHIYQITSEGALQPKCPESNVHYFLRCGRTSRWILKELHNERSCGSYQSRTLSGLLVI